MTPEEKARKIVNKHMADKEDWHWSGLKADIAQALKDAVSEERESNALELEKAFGECETLNLLHGAARLRARGK